jgi:hypothetical protein
MKEIIKIDRESMIQALTESMFDVMECDADYRWLLCQVGFKGYFNMTNPELMQEYREYISEDENADIEIVLENENA